MTAPVVQQPIAMPAQTAPGPAGARQVGIVHSCKLPGSLANRQRKRGSRDRFRSSATYDGGTVEQRAERRTTSVPLSTICTGFSCRSSMAARRTMTARSTMRRVGWRTVVSA